MLLESNLFSERNPHVIDTFDLLMIYVVSFDYNFLHALSQGVFFPRCVFEKVVSLSV